MCYRQLIHYFLLCVHLTFLFISIRSPIRHPARPFFVGSSLARLDIHSWLTSFNKFDQARKLC